MLSLSTLTITMLAMAVVVVLATSTTGLADRIPVQLRHQERNGLLDVVQQFY